MFDGKCVKVSILLIYHNNSLYSIWIWGFFRIFAPTRWSYKKIA